MQNVLFLKITLHECFLARGPMGGPGWKSKNVARGAGTQWVPWAPGPLRGPLWPPGTIGGALWVPCAPWWGPLGPMVPLRGTQQTVV